MKKYTDGYSHFLAVLISSISLAFFLDIYSRFHLFRRFRNSYWDIHLFSAFELSLFILVGIWFIYTLIISRFLKADFKKTFRKDAYTYLPLLLLLFGHIDIGKYTQEHFSTIGLLVVTLFLILLLKIKHLLDIRNFPSKYSNLLTSLSIIIPLLLINYFSFSYLYQKTESPPSKQPTPLIKKLENLYPADPLTLLGDIKTPEAYKIKINEETRNALVLIPPQNVKKKVIVSPNSFLEFGLGIWEESYSGEGDGIQFNIYIEHNQNTEKIYSKYLDPKHYEKDRKWHDVTIDLSNYKNQEIIITFETKGSPEIKPPFERKPDNRDDFAVISNPEIITKQITKSPPPEPNNINIILISIDTLRADHLGCYGYKRKGISPNIDQMASKGLLFENAITPSPWTLPAHISMFTSLLPSYHRMVQGPFQKSKNDNLIKYVRLSNDITTLTEILRSKGYNTTAFSSSGFVSGEFGFFKGFDTYKETSFTDDSSFDELARWLNTTGNTKKFFLFLHTFRVHKPYSDLLYINEVLTEQKTDELSNRFQELRSAGKKHYDSIALNKMNIFKKEITETLYDGGITETDKYIGKLMNKLEKLNLLGNTLVLLTSDHGEEFSDHDPSSFYDSHGHSLYDELLRVPLIMLVPGNFPKGVRIKSQASLIDIMPTLLELSNIKHDNSKMQGTSLVPIMRGDSPSVESEAISESLIFAREKKSIRTNRYKYIYHISPKEVESNGRIFITDNPIEEELYDLEHDPGEKINLYKTERKLCNELKKKINDTLGNAVSKEKDKKDTYIEVDGKLKNSLKALGYIQ